MRILFHRKHQERIAGYENDAALAEQHKPQGEDKFCPMTLKGVTYTEKADAGDVYKRQALYGAAHRQNAG